MLVQLLASSVEIRWVDGGVLMVDSCTCMANSVATLLQGIPVQLVCSLQSPGRRDCGVSEHGCVSVNQTLEVFGAALVCVTVMVRWHTAEPSPSVVNLHLTSTSSWHAAQAQAVPLRTLQF